MPARGTNLHVEEIRGNRRYIPVQRQRKSDTTRNTEEVNVGFRIVDTIDIDEKAYSYKQRCAECGTDTYSGVGW